MLTKAPIFRLPSTGGRGNREDNRRTGDDDPTRLVSSLSPSSCMSTCLNVMGVGTGGIVPWSVISLKMSLFVLIELSPARVSSLRSSSVSRRIDLSFAKKILWVAVRHIY